MAHCFVLTRSGEFLHSYSSKRELMSAGPLSLAPYAAQTSRRAEGGTRNRPPRFAVNSSAIAIASSTPMHFAGWCTKRRSSSITKAICIGRA